MQFGDRPNDGEEAEDMDSHGGIGHDLREFLKERRKTTFDGRRQFKSRKRERVETTNNGRWLPVQSFPEDVYEGMPERHLETASIAYQDR